MAAGRGHWRAALIVADWRLVVVGG